MKNYKNPENTLFIECEKELKENKKLYETGGEFPFYLVEKELKGFVKLDINYLKDVLKHMKSNDDRILLKFCGEDKPLIIEVENKFKSAIAPIVEDD